jgi:hypothetical protein
MTIFLLISIGNVPCLDTPIVLEFLPYVAEHLHTIIEAGNSHSQGKAKKCRHSHVHSPLNHLRLITLLVKKKLLWISKTARCWFSLYVVHWLLTPGRGDSLGKQHALTNWIIKLSDGRFLLLRPLVHYLGLRPSGSGYHFIIGMDFCCQNLLRTVIPCGPWANTDTQTKGSLMDKWRSSSIHGMNELLFRHDSPRQSRQVRMVSALLISNGKEAISRFCRKILVSPDWSLVGTLSYQSVTYQ